MAVDSGFMDKTIKEQFKRPFVIPPTGNHIDFGSLPCIVFLDGLDECNVEREQGRIVDVICESILFCPDSMPFVWIITSRPEAPHLNAPFAQVKADIGTFWNPEIPVDSDEASQKTERYPRAEFVKIQRKLLRRSALPLAIGK